MNDKYLLGAHSLPQTTSSSPAPASTTSPRITIVVAATTTCVTKTRCSTPKCSSFYRYDVTM